MKETESTTVNNFSDDVALDIFTRCLEAGIPFADVVRFLLKHKTGLSSVASARMLNLDRTTLHKQLGGENTGSAEYRQFLLKHLGFEPFETAETILDRPLFIPAAKRLNLIREAKAAVDKSLDPNVDIGRQFLAWIKAGLQTGALSVNGASKGGPGGRSIVHIVPEGVFLVSPLSFETFLKTVNPQYKKKAVPDSQLKRLQSHVEKARVNIKTDKKLNIHTARIKQSKNLLHGFLFPVETFYPAGDSPSVSKQLTLVR